MTWRHALLPMLLVAEFAWLMWCSEASLSEPEVFRRILWGNLEAVLVNASPLLVL